MNSTKVKKILKAIKQHAPKAREHPAKKTPQRGEANQGPGYSGKMCGLLRVLRGRTEKLRRARVPTMPLYALFPFARTEYGQNSGQPDPTPWKEEEAP